MQSQELVKSLVPASEEEGERLLYLHIPTYDRADIERFVYLLRHETDRQWVKDATISYKLAGHLMIVGEIVQDVYAYALGLMARGDALRRMDRDQDALAFFDAAGNEFLSMGDEVGWARTRIGRVSACLQLNRTDEALRDATAAREIFMRHGKLRRAGQIDVNAAVINHELGHYDEALHLYDRAIETYLLQGEVVDLHIARARSNKAVTLAALGKFREAAALHEQARMTFLAFPKQEIAVAREELNIALIFAAQGHYSQALQLFNRSRDLFQKNSMHLPAAEVAQKLCVCLMRLNRTHEAYELAGETVAFFRQMHGHQQDLAYSLLYQAEAVTLEGKNEAYAEADALLQEASGILEKGGLPVLAAEVRLQRAELYFADGQVEASRREAQLVADDFAEQEALPQLARTALLQARIATAAGDTATAYYLCNQALDIAKGQELLDLQYRCHYLLGHIAELRAEAGLAAGDQEAATNHLDEAARYYDRAVQGIDAIQSSLVMDARTSFLEDKGNIYQRAIMLALKQGRKDEALIYVEKAKSRVLGDYLRNNIDIRLRAGDKASEAILDDLFRLREEQAWYSSIVYDAQYDTNLSDTGVIRVRGMVPQARVEMQKRERRIEQLLEQMQLRLVGDLVARQRSQWTNSIVTTLWKKLDRTMLMVEYYLTDQDMYIFQITRGGIDVHVLQGAVPKLERLLSLWRVNLDLAAQAADTPDGGQTFASLLENGLGLLQRLYDLLLKPVANLLRVCEHLVIVPYGILHYFPFHCLFDGNQFLIEREHLNVSYLPAAALFDICRQRGQRISGASGAHGGGSFGNSLVLGLSDGGRLPFAVQEAQTVAHYLGTTPLLDGAATASTLWQIAPRSSIIHIAAHGLFRLDAVNFSYIKLADRQVSTIEAFNLDLSSCSLLTLSACETGRTVIGGVDEVIGLGRGFLYAGAASLLPTLWKVDDASCAELMEIFYQALLGKCGKAVALAGAQRSFLARVRASTQPYRSHPYFWAAFQLIGDAGPVMKV